MNAAKAILTILAVNLFSVASASASDFMWFNFISSPNPQVFVHGQGPGQALHMTDSVFPPYIVRFGINISSGTGALAGWDLSLQCDSGCTFRSGTAVGSNYDQVFGGVVNGSTTANFGRGSVTASGSVGRIYEIELNITSHTYFVTGDFGFQGIVKSNGLYWNGYVGANPISYAAPNYIFGQDHTEGWGFVPVVIAVPEPSSMILFAAGMLVLQCRRS